MPSCSLEILSRRVGYITAKTRGAELSSTTIPGRDADAGVLPTAAAIGCEPEPTGSDIGHEAPKETNPMASFILIGNSLMLPVSRYPETIIIHCDLWGLVCPELRSARIASTWSASLVSRVN